LDTFDAVKTRLDYRSYVAKPVPADVKARVLEAGRSTGSGMNRQHWRFLLIDDKDAIKKLAQDSTSGGWVKGADFAVVVLTDPKLGFHMIDAGRALQDMELTAWNSGVASCIYTGIKEENMRRDFGIPEDLKATAVIGFGYPAKKLAGKKDRKPLAELAHHNKFGTKFDPKKLV